MFDTEFFKILRDPVRAEALKSAYLNASPFPHMVFDGVFSETALMKCVAAFPKPDASWWKYENQLERKFAKDDLAEVHPILQEAVAHLQSRIFTDFLERLTGMQGLIVDQTLRGGGLHQIARGGKLDVHADYNVHPVTSLDRRINVLLYLNQQWQESWKGSLELWNKDMSQAVKSIVPLLGRLVVFSTTDTAYHGHPDPLECPEGYTRKSVALYYYTNGRPKEEKSAPHSTIYKRRPQDPKDPKTEALRQQRAKGRINHQETV